MEQPQKHPHPVRPSIRFFARLFDISIFSTLFLALLPRFLNLNIFYVPINQFPPYTLLTIEILLGMCSLFVWMFVESILLNTWGTTPGKWFLDIHLKDAGGRKLKFLPALKRSFLVWIKGISLGLPLISLITMLVAYNRLTKHGITSWDQSGHLTLIHGKIHTAKCLVMIFIFLALTFSYW